MSTNRNLKEPIIGHDADATDTNDLRRFLGANPTIRDLNDRGILTIKEISDSDEHVFNASSLDTVPDFQYAASILDWSGLATIANQSFAGCEICEGDFHASSREFKRIFADSIASTGRASVALQAIYSVFIQSIHDQLLEFLSIPMTAEVLRTQLNIIPIRRVGLVAVAIIVTINTICILVLTVLYILFVRYSVVGSFWHAISQVASVTSSAVLYHANQKNDHHVSNYLGNDDRLVRLVRSDDTGIVRIVEAK
ncbi:hypothetical protein F5B22DRAFT_645062 [Xylaria bambusicola]|uniref:uncharacterized protein n=1 Tax=Xylaria bambusicola TaxID=326684 RepID=UPI0020088DC1|nr:uncharacterized protein F5B22DRAFT_645062 [Xylaria bambusicola]KAI0518297.1 hypothetical protein F5B22DRAFT_645062 [Xylaria bambusicola]